MAMPLTNGSVVKIWNGSRGHDYVMVAINRSTKKIGLIKHTCINQDNSLRVGLARVHKWISYEEFGAQKIAPRITRVVGTRQVDNAEIREFLDRTGETNLVAASLVHNIVANVDVAADARTAAAL